MFEKVTNSMPRDGSDDAARSQHPEVELFSLYKRLSRTQKGSADHKQILEGIEDAKLRVNAHRQLLRRLMDAVDRERLGEIAETMLIAERRIRREMNKLLDEDLTLTETLRLWRLINTQIEQIDGGLRNPRGCQQRGSNRSRKYE